MVAYTDSPLDGLLSPTGAHIQNSMGYLWPGCDEHAETSWRPDFLQHVWVGQVQAEYPLVEGVGSKVLWEQRLGSAVFFFLPCLLWQGCSTSPFSGPKTSIDPSLCLAALPSHSLCQETHWNRNQRLPFAASLTEVSQGSTGKLLPESSSFGFYLAGAG